MSYNLKNLHLKFVSVFLFPLFGIMTTDDVCRTYLKALFIIFSITKYNKGIILNVEEIFFSTFLKDFKNNLFGNKRVKKKMPIVSDFVDIYLCIIRTFCKDLGVAQCISLV